VLAPAQMLARLVGAGLVPEKEGLLVSRQHGAVPRHQSLRTAIDWSYQLLAPELQRFFARLSVFRGGWTLEAAEAVCEEPRALEYLEQLRQCSLIEATERAGGTAGSGEGIMRFYLLETLREYAAEHLAEDERNALRQQHAQFYLALA